MMRKLAYFALTAQAVAVIIASNAFAQTIPDFSVQPPELSVSKPVPKPRRLTPVVAKPTAKPKEHVATPALPIAPNPQNGETVTQENTKFSSWNVSCNVLNAAPEARHCVAKTGVLRGKDDPRPILFVGVIKDGDQQRFVLQTPTTTELKPGVAIDFGNGNVKRLEFASCEPALCTAEIQLEPGVTEGLKTASTATVSWTALGVGEVKVTFGLEGARDALQFLANR